MFFKRLIDLKSVPLKFVLVGIWNTIFGYGIFIMLYTLFARIFEARYISYMLAIILGRFITIANAFIFHKYITFRSKVKGWAVAVEYFRFFMTYTFTFLLSLVLLPLCVEVFNIIPQIAAAIVMAVAACINYMGHSKFSFRSV
ncbi:GtrA family protein [Candidatus Omnitrophota bacterium]